MKLKERRELISVLRVLWEQEFRAHSTGYGSTGLNRVQIARKVGLDEQATNRILWFLQKSGFSYGADYPDELPQRQPHWITPSGVDHYEDHVTRWRRGIGKASWIVLTAVITSIATALAMRFYGPYQNTQTHHTQAHDGQNHQSSVDGSGDQSERAGPQNRNGNPRTQQWEQVKDGLSDAPTHSTED